LVTYNFKVSSADHSLFIKNKNKSITIVLVYVDDLIITGSDEQEIRLIKHQLRDKFDIKDLGYLKYFLEIEIIFSKKGLFLSQRKYILDLLKETGKIGCKSVSTPIDSRNKLNCEDEDALSNINQFQRLVGKLIYLTVTRPDISYSDSQIHACPKSTTFRGHYQNLNVSKRNTW
jgi:Reverse transcriptase (RNA-dependent DNA polymerase)